MQLRKQRSSNSKTQLLQSSLSNSYLFSVSRFQPNSDFSEFRMYVQVAPVICWSSDRIISDSALSRKLIAKLDAEKSLTNNGLLATGEESTAAVKKESAANVKEADVKEEETANAKTEDGKEANGTAEVKAEANAGESAPIEAQKSEDQGKQYSNLDSL